MSSRKGEGPIESDDPSPTPNPTTPPIQRPDDELGNSLDWGKGSFGNTRGSSYSYLELHGDVHKGQEPPEEKD